MPRAAHTKRNGRRTIIRFRSCQSKSDGRPALAHHHFPRFLVYMRGVCAPCGIPKIPRTLRERRTHIRGAADTLLYASISSLERRCGFWNKITRAARLQIKRSSIISSESGRAQLSFSCNKNSNGKLVIPTAGAASQNEPESLF